MILAIDVYYYDDKAKAVSIAFNNWEDETPTEIKTAFLNNIEEYIPGQFYKRELPCILKVLEQVNLEEVDAIVVDGFVFLDDAGRKGLGAYLYEALEEKIPIIGVAKTSFHENVKNVKAVLRGESKKPLYVTEVGFNLPTGQAGLAKAAEKIKAMHGVYRFPTLLKVLDDETKSK